MKILIISAFPTHPTTAGNLQWILTQSELLLELGHEVHYLWAEVREMVPITKVGIEASFLFWGERFHIKRLERLDRFRSWYKRKIRNHSSDSTLWKCDEAFPESLTKYVNEINTHFHFDVCIVHYFYLSKLFDGITIPIKVLSTHDSFAYRNLRVNDNSLHLSADEEAKAMQRSQYILALQEEERCYFEHLSPRSKVLTVYNYYKFHSQAIVGNKNILFLSSSNPYNMNGICWFLDFVFPKIVHEYPDCKLIIGGAICKHLSKYESVPNLVCQGYIDDISSFYSQGDIAINPVFQGTGLKIKTFESVSYDKVTIVHPHSLEGMFKGELSPLFVAKEPEDWLYYVSMVWNSQKTLMEIKKKNHTYIEDLNNHIVSQYNLFLR